MTLQAGTRLGRYEIRSPLGAGGMGEVYLAQDTQLDRTVAVKILPADVARDQGRMRRFVQEAKAASALNHPNIAHIYEIGEADGASFIAMEHVEGQALDDVISGRPLDSAEIVRLGIQVADALDEAHAKGITHRDIKPSNIMITPRGEVKVLDFGLAKVARPAEQAVPASDVATQVKTAPGIVMGTVQYMSPEQALGRELDHRTDIFSVGVTLYEMATGRLPFSGATGTEIIDRIAHAQPEAIARLNYNVPVELERMVRKCLEKDRDRRYQSARDLAIDLGDLKREIESGTIPSKKAALSIEQPKPRVRPAMWRWVILLLVIAALFLAILYFRPTPADRDSIRFAVSLPGTWITTEMSNHHLAVSPDGQRLAFVVESEGRRMLWVRPRDSVLAKALAGTEGAVSPFWSSDSRWIGFFAEGKLKKIEASGGPPQILCDVPIGDGTGTWSREGTILFAGIGGGNAGIYRVSDTGAALTLVMKPDRSRGEPFLFWPHFLPDGRHFFYTAYDEQLRRNFVFIGSLDTGQSRPAFEASSRVEYVPPGYLLYVREATLLAHPFDAGALKFTGEPIPIAEQVRYFGPTGYADFSASESLLAYRAGVIASRLVWFDRNGREMGAVASSGQYEEPRLSPDEKKVAVGLVDPREGTIDIWLLELTRDLATRITATKLKTEYGPAWSPDGRYLVYTADMKGPPNLYRKMLSGTGDAEELLPVGEVQYADDWSADGRFIVYAEAGAKTKMDLWILPLFGDRKPFPFLNTPSNEKGARFSPDGGWVAYVSDESGKNEVYVQSFQKSDEKWTISTAGGSQPVWRRDGRELFYLAADNKLMVLPVKVGASFEAGVPTVLFRIDPAAQHSYDVTSDGQRFLVNTNVTRAESLPITAVVNWTASLKR